MTRSRRRLVDAAGAIATRDRQRSSRPPTARLRGRATDAASASSRRATATGVRVAPVTAEPRRPTAGDGRAAPMTTAAPDAARPGRVHARPARSTARAVAFVAEHKPLRRGPRRPPRGRTSTTRRVRRALVAGLPPARRSRVPRRAAAGRAGHRRGPWRPLAADGGRRPRVPRRHAATSGPRRCCSSPTGCSARPPRAALVRLRAPRADAARRSGAHVAAPAPRRARGRRLDHGRHARPPVRPRHRSPSRTAGPSSSSSSSRRRAGSAASSARRSRR